MQEFGKETVLGELQSVKRFPNWESFGPQKSSRKYAEDRRLDGCRNIRRVHDGAASWRSEVRLVRKKIVIIVVSRRVALSSRG